MSQWNAGRVFGYSVLAAGLITLGYCARNCADGTSLVTGTPEISVQSSVNKNTIKSGKNSINTINYTITNTIENNYQSKNSGHSNNGTNAGATNPAPNTNKYDQRLRVQELKTEKLIGENNRLEDKVKQLTTPTTPQQDNTQKKSVTIYKDGNGNIQIENDQAITVYQNKDDPNIIMIYTGKQKRHKDVFLENRPMIVNGEVYGSLRYVPMDLRRDNVYRWNVMQMSIQGFVGRFGANYLFDGRAFNAFNSPMNETMRLFNSYGNNAPEWAPRSGF